MFLRIVSLLIASGLVFGCAKEQKPAPAAIARSQELLAKAEQQSAVGDYAGAVATLEHVVKLEPKHRQALYLLGQHRMNQATVLAQRGETAAARDWYVKAAAALKELRSYYPQLSDDEQYLLQRTLYNAGRAEAVAGNTDKAMAALADAIQSGYDDLEQIGKEADFKSLRDLPGFQKLLQDKSAQMSHQAREHANQLLSENKPFPFDFSLTSVEGKSISKKDFQGKVLIVDFWGTWCPPCRAEIPHFEELLKKHYQHGLAVVGLNYEQPSKESPLPLVQKFITDHQLTYPCAIGDDKTSAQVPNLRGFPTTLFLDRSGTVRLKLEGYHPFNELSAIVSALLEEKPAVK